MAEQLVIKVNGDIKNYENSLKEIKDQTSSLEDGLASIAKKSAVAFVGLAAAVTGSVAAYRVQEQVEIKTRQTIKATGQAAGLTAEEIFKMAGSLQKVTTFGDEAIIGGQNLLLTFKNIGKDVFPQVTEVMLDMSAAMGTDLKSSALQLGKALNDPKVGLTALSRVGITFNEQQKQQIKSMQESGDIAGAQTIILKELESQFGGVARATAEGTGAFIQLSNIFGDIIEDIGRELAPSLIELSTIVKGFLVTFQNNKGLVQTIANVLKFGSIITGVVAAVTTAGVVALKLSAIIGALSAIFVPAGLAASGFWVAVTGPIGIAVAGLGLVVAGVAALWAALDKKEGSARVQEINELLDEQEKILKSLEERVNSKNKLEALAAKAGIEGTEARIDALEMEKQKLLEVEAVKAKEKAEKQEADLGTSKKVEAKEEENERLKELRQEELESKIEDLEASADILTEIEIQKTQENIDLKKEQDVIAKAKILERKGKHEQAVALIDDFRKKRQIKESKEKLDREKKEDQDKLKRIEIQNANEIRLERAKTNAILGIAQAGVELAAALSSKNNKAIFAAQKLLAAAQIIITGQVAEAAAVAPPPLGAGPILGAGVASLIRVKTGISLATVVATTAQGFAKGGVVEGGIPGVDSVPIIAQQGEIVGPTQNFEEIIGSVRAKREADALGESQGGQVGIHVTYDSPEASQIITVSQVEDTALGISRDSFKEAS